MGKVIFIVLALFLLFGVFSHQILGGIDTWRSDAATDNFLVTTVGGTSANVTLSFDLYQAVLANVSSVVSSDVTDTPVSTAYDEAAKRLTIGGLAVSLTRTLTVDYTAETQDTGMRTVGPFLPFLILGGIIAVIFLANKRRG